MNLSDPLTVGVYLSVAETDNFVEFILITKKTGQHWWMVQFPRRTSVIQLSFYSTGFTQGSFVTVQMTIPLL